jgi:hypothetical protein
MIGTRQWISKVQTTLDLDNLTPVESPSINVQYFKKLLKQAKKISHVISYIWLNEDRETAQELDGYFKRGDDEELKKLLFAKDPPANEYKLLLKVFKHDQYLPIFGEDDREFIKFRVVTDRFEGNISEPGPSDNNILTVTIPYPPRPEITDDTGITESHGYTVIKKSELREWLSQSPHDKPYFNEKNCYIPPSSS